MLKIFISYSQRDKEIAGKLKKVFEEYDVIECFVAHDDIDPGSEWEQKIITNLESSALMMPIQTENLKESYWCQQEIGFALARKITIVPLIPVPGGIDPVGFYSKFQGFKVKLSDLRGSVKIWLIQEGLIQGDKAEEIEKRLVIFESSDSFYEAGLNTKSLLELESSFTNGDICKIAEIATKNGQILSSFSARDYLRPFFIKYAAIIPKDYLEIFLKLN